MILQRGTHITKLFMWCHMSKIVSSVHFQNNNSWIVILMHIVCKVKQISNTLQQQVKTVSKFDLRLFKHTKYFGVHNYLPVGNAEFNGLDTMNFKQTMILWPLSKWNTHHLFYFYSIIMMFVPRQRCFIFFTYFCASITNTGHGDGAKNLIMI